MTDPTKTAAADAAGTAADYSARATYARGWEDGAKARPLGVGEAEYLAAKDDALQLRRALQAAESRIAVEASRAAVEQGRTP